MYEIFWLCASLPSIVDLATQAWVPLQHRGEVTSLTLDLSAAFDIIDHSIFLTRLQIWFVVDDLNWFV